MATIVLTELGLLPTGVHDCTMDEISEAFGRFWRSDKRLKLLDRLRAFVDAVWKVDEGIQILVDGSFIMRRVDEPGDIDVALILPIGWNLSVDLPPFKYNVLSKRMVRKIHGFDMLVGLAGEKS